MSNDSGLAKVNKLDQNLFEVSVSREIHSSLLGNYDQILGQGVSVIAKTEKITSIVPIAGFVSWPNGTAIAITTRLFVFVA